jgi:hypothetical protein
LEDDFVVGGCYKLLRDSEIGDPFLAGALIGKNGLKTNDACIVNGEESLFDIFGKILLSEIF